MDLYKAPDGSFLYSSPDQLNKGQALCQPAHGFNELTLTLLQVRAFSASFQEPHIKENLFDQVLRKKVIQHRHVQTLTVIRSVPGLQASLANG